MLITRGPYAANVNPLPLGSGRTGDYRVVVTRYGAPLYEQLEHDFEQALRVARAFVDWEWENHTDS